MWPRLIDEAEWNHLQGEISCQYMSRHFEQNSIVFASRLDIFESVLICSTLYLLKNSVCNVFLKSFKVFLY